MANYYSEQQIKKARAMDLLTYLQTYEPTELVHISDAYTEAETQLRCKQGCEDKSQP